MKTIIKNILSQIGSIASLVGLLYTIKDTNIPFTGWQWFLLFISITFFIISIVIIVIDYNENKPLIFKNKIEIRNYMFSCIEKSGHTVIFTRDMSWVCDKQMEDMLNNKAQNGELTICLPKRIQKVIEYENSGAKIIEYARLNLIPQSRFTISNYGRQDAKIAVGSSISNGKHLIEEFGNGEHPYFYVANDLINILGLI